MNTEKITGNFKINLNQNLWALVIGLLGLGLSDYFLLGRWIRILSGITATAALTSLLICLVAYTVRYVSDKVVGASEG